MNEETLTIENFIRLLKSHIKTNHYKYSDSFETVVKDLIEQISDTAEEKGYRNGYSAGYDAGQYDKKQELIENLRTML
jgi:hypothetical protein